MARRTLIRPDLLIDGTGRTPVADTAAVVEGDRIVAVGPAESIGSTDDVMVTGGALIPGLIDAHVHLFPSAPGSAGRFLTFGVTTVRDTGGPLDELVRLRNAVHNGSIIGPRVFFAGVVDRPPPIHDAVRPVDSVTDIRQEIVRMAQAGAIAVKFYINTDFELAATVIACANEYGLPTIAHLGRTGATEAVNLGIYGLEHAYATALRDIAPPDYQDRASDPQIHHPSSLEMYRILAAADPHGTDAVALARLLSDRGVYLTATLVAFERLTLVDDLESVHDDQADDRHPRPNTAMFPQRTTEELHMMRRGFRTALEFTGEVHRAGGKLLVGSDNFVPILEPGKSLHRELELLVEAGLTPMEALVAATHGNAEAMGLGADLGTIEPGKYADMVVLRTNPLDNISSSRDIRHVIQNGNLVNR